MATCAYCQLPATATIPATPGRVCVTHAIEFWGAFLAFAKEARLEGPPSQAAEPGELVGAPVGAADASTNPSTASGLHAPAARRRERRAAVATPVRGGRPEW